MHPALINAALKMQGITHADIARQCGRISSTAVYQVIHGKGRSKRIENRIAALTRIPLEELWPAWYGNGKNDHRMRPEQVATALRAVAGRA